MGNNTAEYINRKGTDPEEARSTKDKAGDNAGGIQDARRNIQMQGS